MTNTTKKPSSHVSARREANRVGKLHHHAFHAKDMEATRHFYEDLLGMPLVGTWVERVNPVTGQPDNYVHTFFELSDGSCIAFFQFKSPESSLKASVNGFENINPFGHHLALTVEGKEEILYFKGRLNEAGVEVFETDHGYCHSIYFHDPNGMQVELTTLVPESEQIMEEAAGCAHDVLRQWMNEDDVAGNNTHRGEGWVANH